MHSESLGLCQTSLKWMIVNSAFGLNNTQTTLKKLYDIPK